MFCDNCGTELADDEVFCSSCGNRVKARNKNIYIALVLTFFLSGLGSIYAGDMKKGLALLIIRILTAAIGVFVSIFFVFSILVWVYAFYEAYRDVQIANGYRNPKFLNDFKRWNDNNKIIAVVIICIILIFAIGGCISFLTYDNHTQSDSKSHYYSSGSGSSSSGSSSHSSHYSGVDTSPQSIAKNDPDWYYDHYEYGDDQDIDEYLESQGYD